MRISGVPVGKVKTIEPDKKTGRSDVVIQLDSRVRAAALRRQGDPAPEDAAGRDLRRADPGHAAGRRRCRRAGGWRTAQVSPTVELDEIFRSFDPKTRRRSRCGCRRRRRRSRATGATSTTRSATSARSPRTPARRSTSSTARRGRVRRLISNTGVVFGALTERGDQLRGLIENSNHVFATTAARDRELQEAFVALPTFERESRQTLNAPQRVRQGHRPARHAAAPGGARAEPDADRPVRARARPEGAVPRPRQADHGLAHGLPGRRADPRGPAAAAQPGRPGAAPAHPDPRGPRRLQGRADRVLRQHRGGDPGLRPAARACTTCARRTRSTPRTSPRIRAASAPTGRTRTSCRAATASCPSGLEVYETRHCGRAAADDLDHAAGPGADRRPRLPAWPVPTVVPDRRAARGVGPHAVADRPHQPVRVPGEQRAPAPAVHEAGQVPGRRRDDATTRTSGRRPSLER